MKHWVATAASIFSTHTIRVLLAMALLVISYLAFTPLDTPVVTEFNDKLSHIVAFFALAFLVDFSWPRSKWNPLKYLPLFGYGLFIEVVQAFMPHRIFSTWDLVADILGLLIYPLLLPLLLRIPLIQALRNGASRNRTH
ncbi:MAG: VanZ family protein [Candidatus Thiodiazotropha endolucinida]|uniref:VanZ like family protein n=2 Tax=Candidatus Thiodiazotropha TaxID=1913444 RepID=A0A7Z1AGB2_9GAMM|nr:VanZ family protein [Candidatus Thiodiazotropha endolucinida]MCG7877102.1 VanZ family protein [Candidatus Thiodiazotropha taylori]MCG7863245.1 VanZ family protein [Candidatus Thiodiazotropha endolucinida]MCG7883832.1 VanZ family protein [Candidatus Thiodiazotropha taylori]MCG7884601.1 VanZ family protein [Candidatus Thiodiazotropha taylori]MCG7889001.1 VanZ family protein [Candidatus Thiodiazotropha taylori]